ncbi:MAG: hypothetical protein K2P81_02305 [Bacteriovoracaceae bacterium]|nr:hypothetical protein [Bacteriovoracaceae bacterium]
MLTCKQVPEELMKVDLNWREKAQLRFHLFICSRCKELKRQFDNLNDGLHRYINKAPTLDANLAQKILDKKFKKFDP